VVEVYVDDMELDALGGLDGVAQRRLAAEGSGAEAQREACY
jgi:hypothetical protein